MTDGRLPDGDLTQGYPTPNPSILPLQTQLTYRNFERFLGMVNDPRTLRQLALTQFLQYLAANALTTAFHTELMATQQRCNQLLAELIETHQRVDVLGQTLADIARNHDELEAEGKQLEQDIKRICDKLDAGEGLDDWGAADI